MESEGPKSAWAQKSQSLAAAEKNRSFCWWGTWLCFTGSKNQLDILIFSAGSDCNIGFSDYISQNPVFRKSNLGVWRIFIELIRNTSKMMKTKVVELFFPVISGVESRSDQLSKGVLWAKYFSWRKVKWAWTGLRSNEITPYFGDPKPYTKGLVLYD